MTDGELVIGIRRVFAENIPLNVGVPRGCWEMLPDAAMVHCMRCHHYWPDREVVAAVEDGSKSPCEVAFAALELVEHQTSHCATVARH